MPATRSTAGADSPQNGAENVPEYVVVTGLSGAGRSTAAKALEDLGWFVIDNLPASLIPKVADLMALHSKEHASVRTSNVRRLALVAGSRDHYEDLEPSLDRLRASGARLRIAFLNAPTEVLVQRFDDTKRRHPLHNDESESVVDAIEHERSLLEPMFQRADLIIDTGGLSVHDLRERLREAFGDPGTDISMTTAVMSFGYKHGVPNDADLVFDCRFLPNPHWQPALRPLTGRDKAVSDFVFEQEAAQQFFERVMPLLDFLVPAYGSEGRAYLTIAFGCTGGRHRSVAVAEEIAKRLSSGGHLLHCRHRDLDR